MIIPTKDSMNQVIQSILDKDYIENPEAIVEGDLEYPEEVPMDIPVNKFLKIAKSNYIEMSKPMQSAYENQFRSFSSRKAKDSFEELI